MTTRPPKGTEVQRALGETFRQQREAAGISLKVMAKLMKRSINTIRWHEAGSRSLRADDLVLAAGVIGCSPTILMENPQPAPDTADGQDGGSGGADEADAATA